MTTPAVGQLGCATPACVPARSRWARRGADSARILPQISTGMASKAAGVGHVGAGLVTAAVEISPHSLEALAERAGRRVARPA